MSEKPTNGVFYLRPVMWLVNIIIGWLSLFPVVLIGRSIEHLINFDWIKDIPIIISGPVLVFLSYYLLFKGVKLIMLTFHTMTNTGAYKKLFC